MTGSAADPPAYQPHLKRREILRDIKARAKDAADSLELVIVRGMWPTGFDAPPVHTMYVDKPMQGAGLMQAIARVNRTFADKPGVPVRCRHGRPPPRPVGHRSRDGPAPRRAIGAALGRHRPRLWPSACAPHTRTRARQAGAARAQDRSQPPDAVLLEVVVLALRAHRTRQRMERLVAGSRWVGSGHVFATRVGTPLHAATATRAFQTAPVRAGLPHNRFHDLRHAAATFLLAQGFTLEDVKEPARPQLDHADFEHLWPRAGAAPAAGRGRHGRGARELTTPICASRTVASPSQPQVRVTLSFVF